MSRADDLTSLLAPPPAPELSVRQGTVLTYHNVTGANTISVAGAVLTDVPFLNPGGYTIYLPGDVVLLLRLRSTWSIIGRFTSPGPTKAIGRYTELSGVYTSPFVTNYPVTTSNVVQATASVYVPSWAEVAVITASLMLLAHNDTGADDYLQGRVDVLDGFTAMSSATVPPAKFGQVTVTHHTGVFVTGGSTLDITGSVRSIAAAWAADTSNIAYLQATIAWNSNDGS